MLSTKQVDFFQENGYLILENLIDTNVIKGWREQIWKHFDFQFGNTRDMAGQLCGRQLRFFSKLWTLAGDAGDN